MSNKTISMHQIREVLRLHGEGYGTKYISRATRVACYTVKKYLLRFVALWMPLREVEKQSDRELSRIFLSPLRSTETTTERMKQLEGMLPLMYSFSAITSSFSSYKGGAFGVLFFTPSGVIRL